MIKSQALEANIASYHVDVAIDPRYAVIQEVLSHYYGLGEGLNLFLKELSHPYKSWQFIVNEARGYAFDYFHVIRSHPQGPEAAALFIEIFDSAVASTSREDVRTDAADNLLLFLQKIIQDAGTELVRFGPVLTDSFERIYDLADEHFFVIVKSYYQIKRIGQVFLKPAQEAGFDPAPFNRLCGKYFARIFTYWLSEEDPWSWFKKEAELKAPQEGLEPIFEPISHTAIRQSQARLEQILAGPNPAGTDTLARLLELPDYRQIADTYREIPRLLFEAGKQTGKGNRWKVIFLFHIMNIAGLSVIHEETLRDINRTLGWLIEHESSLYINRLIQKTFSILKTQTSSFTATALNCVLNMGIGVYRTDDSDLVNFFIDGVIDLGFQVPMLGGVGNDWQIKVNNAHILNVRTWLQLIRLNPKWSTRLISNLIIYISLCGVFIKDTDLFPRDVTALLNSDIGPVYNLIKQLARLFPVYFNDIGAEGRLRDISTRIDEITNRRDVLIHFLRKQSHVESSNRIIGFMEAIFRFWESGEKGHLEAYVPPSIFEQIDVKGPFVTGMHRIMAGLGEKGLTLPESVIDAAEGDLSQMIDAVSGVSEQDRERGRLFFSFYKLLYQKYRTGFFGLETYIAQLSAEAFPELKKLSQALKEPDLKKRIFSLIDYLEGLKKLILSNVTYESREDIYKKRHFTVDIPSMYGSYHETKFDALGLTFRIESLLNVLFEELVVNTDLSLVTKAAFYEIYDRLLLFDKALKLDGISSGEMEQQLDMLAHSIEVKAFTITQYLDIFKGLAKAVKNIINDYFSNIHEENLDGVLEREPLANILPKYLPKEAEETYVKIKHRISEIFFRDRITLSVGLQQLDLFLSRILNTLFHQTDKLPADKLHKLLLYDPKKIMTPISNSGSLVSQVIYLGNKGFNLVKLRNFGFPVPPGFIVTTEVFRFQEVIQDYPPAQIHFQEQIRRHISQVQQESGKVFGDLKNPMLFSVRSGSSVSQPGMMDTFLDVGINEEIAAAIAKRTANRWFAWDNYRRFLQCYGMSFGLERDDFDAIINDHKKKWGVPLKREFSGEQMQEVALKYKEMIRDHGHQIIEDPFEQLLGVILRVLRSWESPRAKTYRRIMGISDDWGTAVTVQQMVYGNISPESGSGVFFTHNPRWSEDSLRLWGDFTTSNQGEDIVAGLVNTLPISISQQEIETRNTDMTLETHYPEIFKTLKAWANDLIYEKGWSPQEMEFTFESPRKEDLYLLQTRDMAIRERKKSLTFDLEGISEKQVLGHGIGVGGGALSGRLVFSLEDIDTWHKIEPERSLILARGDTVPDDIREIYAADGLLTARGGVTSHAAVVAHRLGKTCVVGCGNLVCDEKNKQVLFNGMILKTGAYISIDGRKGTVYRGLLTPVGSPA